MFLATLFLSLSFTPDIQSIKLLIDGTIDFGPSWGLKYKLKPFGNAQAKETISITRDAASSNENYSSKNSKRKNVQDEAKFTVVDNFNESGNIERTAMDSSDSVDSKSDESLRVTNLLRTVTKTTKFFIYPRQIKEDGNVTDFMEAVRNKSLSIFDLLAEKHLENAQHILELKERFKSDFGIFMNVTRDHYIKTAIGTKKVVLNIIDNAHKLLERLANRFEIDVEHDTRNGRLIARLFRNEIDRFKREEYGEACRIFGICRVGNEYTDFCFDLITLLLKADDVKVKLAIQALTQELKQVNVSKIMDNETMVAFHAHLSTVEELSPADMRFMMIGHLLLLANKHLPFFSKTPKGPWLQKIVATYYILEIFNENIKMTEHNQESCQRMKKKLKEWIFKPIAAGALDKGAEVRNITNNFLHQMQTEGIDKFNEHAATDLKSNFRLLILQKTPPIHSIFAPF